MKKVYVVEWLDGCEPMWDTCKVFSTFDKSLAFINYFILKHNLKKVEYGLYTHDRDLFSVLELVDGTRFLIHNCILDQSGVE